MTSWFITKNGRLFTRTIVSVAAASVGGACIAFNGPFLNTYQSFLQMYSDGVSKPLPPEVLQTADGVLTDCKEHKKIYINEEKKNVKFFACIGRDLFHAGCTKLPWGAIVGLPFMFGVKDKNDIDLFNLKIHGKDSIDWASEGEELLQSVILSENAQKFAIAREVVACTPGNLFMEPFFFASAILMPARIIQRVNGSGRTWKYPFKIRAAFYAALYVGSFIIIKCLRDLNRHGDERVSDHKAASLGSEYLEGGIEFYEKTLRKNKALQKLMGPEGERYYDENGDENHLVSFPHRPVTKRLAFLQSLKKNQAEATS